MLELLDGHAALDQRAVDQNVQRQMSGDVGLAGQAAARRRSPTG